MTDPARTEIMARIRHATRGASTEAIAGELQALGRSPVAELPAADLPRAFLANVLKNQGTADVARNRSEAVKAVGHYLYQHHRSHRIVAGNDPRLAAMPWRDGGVLPRFGAAEDGEPAALSYARVGVAEAGAVVTFTGKANPAANNLLAEHHLVLVNSEDLVPDLEAGNMLGKQLSYLANADSAGIVLGARVPIILTSRADSAEARLASCAVAVAYAYWKLENKDLKRSMSS